MMNSILLSSLWLSMAHADDVVPKLKLVGLYDASSVLSVSKMRTKDYIWKPSRLMTDSCGPAKGPDNLGMFEAEIVGNQQGPSLAIVLEHTTKPKYIDAMGESCDPLTQQPCEPLPRAPLSAEDISIGLGIGKIDYQLKPMVNPRFLAIEINGHVEQETTKPIVESGLFDTSRYQKLIRTQMEIELCLEHKVGRGWTGSDEKRMRQAFLLDPPDGELSDRKYFNGQRDPVSALIGPPDACVTSSVEMPKDPSASKGESKLSMTPSDVWGASLRECSKGTEEGGVAVASPSKTLPLRVSENKKLLPFQTNPKWSAISIDVRADGNEEKDVFISVNREGSVLPGLDNVRLFPMADKTDDPRKKGAMLDILARINHTYPTTGTKEDPNKYVTLLIPNWQISEGLRRLYSRKCEDKSSEKYCTCTVKSYDAPLWDTSLELNQQLDHMDGRLKCLNLDNDPCSLSRVIPDGKKKSAAQMCLDKMSIDRPMESGGTGLYDGVGWVLEHPEHLFVQVDTRTEPQEGFQILDLLKPEGEESDVESESQKPNLTGVIKGPGKYSIRDWGYTVGLMAARSPIVTPTKKRATWLTSSLTQRSNQQSYFSIALFTLLAFLLVGLRRWPDFWTRTPEERAYYWPGRQAQNKQSEPEGVDLEAAGSQVEE